MITELICPGLFGPIDVAEIDGIETRTLDKLLARSEGEQTPARDPARTLAERFGVATAPGIDLPSAPLCLSVDSPDVDKPGYWLHADPVHLRPDRDQLLLFAGPSLAVGADEAAALAGSFNDHFGSDGLSLLVTRSGRWYLHPSVVPDLLTHPVREVTGRRVDAFLPTGADARDWIRWQNEAQMLFFDHPVNQARERRGAPTIGGVWPWGGGVLPRVPSGPDLVVSDHPLALGLAKEATARTLSVDDPGLLDAIRSAASTLVFWDRLWWPALEGDSNGWIAGIEALEGLVTGLLAPLMDGHIRALLLDDGVSRRFEATRGRLRRFWRRGSPLADRARGPMP